MEYPTIDGHFWVVRDGKIIDPVFNGYKYVCKVHDADVTTLSHIPAPMMTQKIMINIFTKVMENVLWSDNCFDKVYNCFDKGDNCFDKFYKMSMITKNSTPEWNRCWQNCLIEIYENGGEIVFGSLGFKYKNKEGFWYEYGGEDYKTIKDFIK